MTLEKYLKSIGFEKIDAGYTAKKNLKSNTIINGQPIPGKEIIINLTYLGEGSIDEEIIINGYSVEFDGRHLIDVWDDRDDENFFKGVL